MPQASMEEIDAIRSGERNTYFAGLKGFLLSVVKEGIPTIIIGAAAGAAIAGAALLGVGGAQMMGWIAQSTTFTGTAGALGFVGLVSAASGALSGALVGLKGAYKEISHARMINGLIDHEIQNVRAQVKSRSFSVAPEQEAAAPAERPDYLQKIIEAGDKAHPKTQLAKLMHQREEAALNAGEVTLH
ncbi:MAG: hypothetical protein U1E36_08130 [Rickettsiales bacterium]